MMYGSFRRSSSPRTSVTKAIRRGRNAREFAPAGWNFDTDRRPDVVFMTFTGGSTHVQEIATQFKHTFHEQVRVGGPGAEISEEWSTFDRRTEGKSVPKVRARGGGQDPSVLTRPARHVDVGFFAAWRLVGAVRKPLEIQAKPNHFG